MSPVPRPAANMEPAAPAAGPEVVPSPVQPSPHWKWLVPVCLAAVALAGAAVLRWRHASRTAPAAAVRTTKAVRRDLLNTVRLSGSIAAEHYADISAPHLQAPDNGRGMVLLYLSENGSMVKEGEKVAEVDGQAVKDHVDDVQAQVSQSGLDLLRVKANQAAQMENIRQRVRAARGALDRAEQDVRAAPVKNRIDQELLKLAVDEAQANYEAAAKEVEMYMESQAAALHLAEFAQQSQVRHLDRHQSDIAHLVMKAPISGRAVVRSIFRNGEQAQVRVGDELNVGQTFLRIVDASNMNLETSMNQAESELVRVGQRALIRFDAYPEIRLNGKVVSVGTIAVGGRRVNYYVRRVPVRIAIQEQDPRVLPDLTPARTWSWDRSPTALSCRARLYRKKTANQWST